MLTKDLEGDKIKALLLDFDAEGGLGEKLRAVLESSAASEMSVKSQIKWQTFKFDVEDSHENKLPGIIRSHDPSLLLAALPQALLINPNRLVRILRQGSPHAPIVVATDAAGKDQMLEMLKLGISDFITPPLMDSDILARIERLSKQARHEETVKQSLKERLGLQQLIGKSEVFLAEMEKISLLAKSNVSVLISGETGTGKEMVARSIHYLSQRASKPFVPLNCGAIPVDLVENELFGHERGAFTSASGSTTGLIQEADKGTLFLDEVDSLPLLAQVKLLRFLQHKEYRPLGSTKTLKGDVRIIAASNADLEEAVASGKVRQDLYYRLNVIPITMPPLRERPEDIPLLAEHFLAKYAVKFDSPTSSFSMEAMRKLMLYSWPGNVRELEHFVERAVVLCDREIIDESHVLLPYNQRPGTRIVSGSKDQIDLSIREEIHTKSAYSL